MTEHREIGALLLEFLGIRLHVRTYGIEFLFSLMKTDMVIHLYVFVGFWKLRHYVQY